MWVRYTIVVSFLALLVAYVATLFVGWSLAGQAPTLGAPDQISVLARNAALAVVAWPIWALHWYWTKRDWQWESITAQIYLAFFTIFGLAATVWIGLQFVTRTFEVLLGTRTADGDTAGVLLGALWSTVFSLALWIYHGRLWLAHRRKAVD